MADADQTALNSVEDDVEKLAQYFKDRYESIEKAKSQFDSGVLFDHYSFEVALKKWGVKVADAAELFEFIDLDMSGQITFHELFHAVEQPLEEIKKREKVRQEREVSAIYQDLAERMRVRFGSVEDMFKKQASFLQHDEEGDTISLAGFRRLVKQLDMEMTASQLTRVFAEIDDNKTGKVSKDELQNALRFHLVRGYLEELAMFMTRRDESIAKAFELAGAQGEARRSSIPASAVSSIATDKALGSMGNEEFLRLLRRMKVLDSGADGDAGLVNEETARFLLLSLRPQSAEDFKAQLERVHAEALVHKKYESERKQRLERESKLKLQDAVRSEQPKKAENEIADWWTQVQEAKRVVRPEEVTSTWDLAARCGGSRMQIQDYVTVLEKRLSERENDLSKLREEVEELRGEMPTDLSPSDRSSPSMSPVVRVKTPHDGHLDLTLRQKSEAMKAEKLIQAASSGDVGAVERLLHQRANVNVVGWGGVTPLMAAARHGRITVLRYLCERRGDLTRTDAYGRTAVDHAARSATARDWLRGQGALTGSEIKAEAEMIAQRMIDMQDEWQKLEEYRNKLPSRDLLRRTSGRRRAPTQSSLHTPGAASPLQKASPRDGAAVSFLLQDLNTPSFTTDAFARSLRSSTM